MGIERVANSRSRLKKTSDTIRSRRRQHPHRLNRLRQARRPFQRHARYNRLSMRLSTGYNRLTYMSYTIPTHHATCTTCGTGTLQQDQDVGLFKPPRTIPRLRPSSPPQYLLTQYRRVTITYNDYVKGAYMLIKDGNYQRYKATVSSYHRLTVYYRSILRAEA